MDPTYRPAPDVSVLPSSLVIPGAGTMTINAYVLHAREPVLIDTGIGADGAAFIDALEEVIDPAELRWIWITHDDLDHTGNLVAVLERAPNARIAMHGLGALRLSTAVPLPLDRVHAVRPRGVLDVGDRTLYAIRPPVFDNPTTVGFVDESTGAVFCVDTFGALLPGVAQHVDEVPRDALVGGMTGWATFDSPWLHLVDRARFDAEIDALEQLEPTVLLGSHLPAAPGAALELLASVLSAVPDAEPFVAPDAAGFEAMLAEMLAAAG